MKVSASRSPRRHASLPDAPRASSITILRDAAQRELDAAAAADVHAFVTISRTDDSLDRVMADLSHDLRQPLTSLNMNLQTALKLLQRPTPLIPAALEALSDCLSVENDMMELLLQAKRRATTFSTHAPLPLNELAHDLHLAARCLEPHWRLRLSERLADPSPIVTAGFARLRLSLLSILRRSLILDETANARSDGIVIETRRVDERAELRFTGLPVTLSTSYSFQSLHMLIMSLVRYVNGHAHLALHDERVTFVISAPVSPMSTLRLPGGHHGD